jgi:replicative DNA helicase
MNFHDEDVRPVAGRKFPAIPEAEETLIGCALGCESADETVDLAVSAGIVPESFSDSSNRSIWESILLSGSFDKITVESVVRNLVTDGVFEAIGGFKKIGACIGRAPTGLMRKFAIEDIVWKHLQRKAINLSTKAIEDSFNCRGDPSEFLGKIATEAAEIAKAGTPPAPEKTISDSVAEEDAQVEAEISGTATRGTISTPFPTFNDYFGLFCAGELVTLAGRPGLGKTSLGLAMAYRAASEGRRTIVVSLEMRTGELLRIIAAQKSGISAHRIERETATTQRDFRASLRDLATLKTLRIVDDEHDFDRIVPLLREERRRGPLGLVVLDYLQIIRPPRSTRGEMRERQVAAMSGELKLLAGELDCPIIVLAQLNRGNEKEGNREPRKSDLRESGAIEQDADKVILLHWPEKDQTGEAQNKPALKDEKPRSCFDVLIIVDKNRRGPRGRHWLVFNSPIQRFNELDLSGRSKTEAQPTVKPPRTEPREMF